MRSNRIGPILFIHQGVASFMTEKYVYVLAAGILASLLVAVFLDVYAGGIIFIIVLVLGMSFFIMSDTRVMPDVHASLSEDAKTLIIRNRGNADAIGVHATIVPHDIEIDRERMAPDEPFTYPLASMMDDGKAIITFKDEKGRDFVERDILSPSLADEDLLKPMFPLFRWK